jgi:hypothetical protein
MIVTRQHTRRSKKLAVAASLLILILLSGCAGPLDVSLDSGGGGDCRLVSGQWECP